jgi:Domain of unknown function (DUF397)
MSSTEIEWKISSASGGTSCVEVAFVNQKVLVRDSKDRDGGILTFSGSAWRDFITSLAADGPP